MHFETASKPSPQRRRAWKACASYPSLLRGVEVNAFFASREEVYTSREKRAWTEGRLREKEEKEKGQEEKKENGVVFGYRTSECEAHATREEIRTRERKMRERGWGFVGSFTHIFSTFIFHI